MKQLKFLSTLGIAFVFLFSSCSGDENKTTDTTATDDSTSITSTTDGAATTATSESTVTTTPETIMIIWQKVANFAKWKTLYDTRDSLRHANGLSSYVVGRGMSDSNMVIVILKMADVNKAKELAGSKEMKERMKKSGVIGTPTFEYLDVVMDDSSPIEQMARLMVTHKVKDWDAWKKSFDEHKQARMDAGLIDRGLGYRDGDNHMVSIVFAVTDKKKADDFSKSKDLKDKMAEAGVDGPPSFFYYDIVQKY